MALPDPIRDFLALYPHPAFALRATPLLDALTTRPQLGASTTASADTSTRGFGGMNTARAACEATGIIMEGSSIDNQGNYAQRHRGARPSSRGPGSVTSSSRKRHGSMGLSSDRDGGDAESVITDSSVRVWDRSTLLEGGDQKDHDSSRTAEGAVAAHQQQIQNRRAERSAKKLAASAAEAAGLPPQSQPSVSASAASARTQRNIEAAVKADKWASSLQGRQSDATDDQTERSKLGQGRGLNELLTPIWSNGKYADLLRRKLDVHDSNQPLANLSLLDLLSRNDLQSLLALLCDVLTHQPGIDDVSSFSDNTISLTLRFPRTSIQNRLTAARRLDRSKPPRVSANANAYTSSQRGSTSGGSATGSSNVSTKSTGLSGSDSGPTPTHNFQLVATLMKDQDLVVFTSITSNIAFTRSPPPSVVGESVEADTNALEINTLTKPSPERSVEMAPPKHSPIDAASLVANSVTPPLPMSALSTLLPPSIPGVPAIGAEPAMVDQEQVVENRAYERRPPLTHRHTSLSTDSSDQTLMGDPSRAPLFSDLNSAGPTSSGSALRASSLDKYSVPDVETPSLETSGAPKAVFGYPSIAAGTRGRSSQNEANDSTPATGVSADPTESVLMSLGYGDQTVDPARAFVTEKHRKKKKKSSSSKGSDSNGVSGRSRRRQGEGEGSAKTIDDIGSHSPEGLAGVAEAPIDGQIDDRELTLEEQKEAGRRERQARRWREEQTAAGVDPRLRQHSHSDSEGSDYEEDDPSGPVADGEGGTGGTLSDRSQGELDLADLELDELRRQTRTGSVVETPTDESDRNLQATNDNPIDPSSDPEDFSAPLRRVNNGLTRNVEDEEELAGEIDSLGQRGIRAVPNMISVQKFLNVISATPCGQTIMHFPWENTSLGPIVTWSSELRVMVMRCLATPQRFSLWWGQDHVLIYNDEYAAMLGSRHPSVLGISGAVGWAEVWDALGPLAARVMQGESIHMVDQPMSINRDGFLEECYHTFSFLPVRNGEGQVVGYENPSTETTPRVIAERRLAVLRDLAQITQLMRTTKDFFKSALQIMSGDPFDLPFALAYSVEPVTQRGNKRTHGSHAVIKHPLSGLSEAQSSGNSASHKTNLNERSLIVPLKLVLQGCIGVPDKHPSAPSETVIKVDTSNASYQQESSHESDTSSVASNTLTSSSNTTGDGTFPWPFQEACTSRKPVFIAELGGRARGFEQRGWPSEARHAVVIPLVIDGEAGYPKACIIVGLNPRRPWNEIYATFINLMARSLSMGLLNVTMAESEAQRTRELVQIDEAKTRFFSNVSHELRTPLTLILGPLEDVLSNRSVRGEDRERLLMVQRHAHRLLNMVNTLLDFSRLEGGQMEVTFRPVSFSALTADLASQFRSAIERGGVELLVDTPAEPLTGPKVYIATDLYEKCIFNLLSNALKYTAAGRITVQVRYNETRVHVSIMDTGCGIEEKELSLIFDRFHRVESTSRTAGGTGIGLALTLELVKALGGTLSVESKTEVGSTFTVTLPRGKAHLPREQVIEEAAEPLTLPPHARNSLAIVEDAATWRLEPKMSDQLGTAAGFQGTVSSPSATSLSDDPFALSADLLNLKDSTILLADDNADLRHYLAALLGRAFRVVQVADGKEALDYCLKNPPSLVVSDVMMPVMNGQQLLEALRANSTTALIPVIFLSAQAGPEARLEALTSGCDDYLCKPFQGRELLARVNIHLQLGKMRLELERRVEERTRALIESEMRFRALADRYSTLSLLSPVGIFMADVHGQVNYANPRFYDISGCDPEGDLRTWRENIVDDDRAEAERIWQQATQGVSEEVDRTTVTTMEFRWKERQNWVLFEIRPFSEDGQRRGFVGSITDISSQKHVEALHIQEVERRAQDAEDNRRNTDAFLDMSSHELRNPLSGVWQNAQVVGESLERYVELLEELREGAMPDADALESLHLEMLENVDAVESIILCASHQQRIADDILNVSKLNMGLLSIQPVPFELADKISEVISMFSVECQQKAIKLSVRKAASIADLNAGWIEADPGRIAQVLLNLISNALKYTMHAKQRRITVHLDAYSEVPVAPNGAMRVSEPNSADLEPGSVWVTIGVEDSGKGLTEAELKKLFARFAQANPKSDQYGGSGLGLYVSKKLVELHKGFIEVESTPGQGSLFRFAIPAKRAVAPEHGARLALPSATAFTPTRSSKVRPGSGSAQVRPPAPSPPAAQAKSDPLAPSRVLIVEDNAINQKVLSRQLKNAGYICTVANNGREGLDVLLEERTKTPNSSPIAVVLMDVEMPVMGGLEAIRLLREMEKTGEMPVRYNVIAVTGNARKQQIDECLEAGFDDFAVKPYNFSSLLAQMRAFDSTKKAD